jgi:hypothetical protein
LVFRAAVDIAGKVGVTRRSLSTALAEASNPRFDPIAKITRAFGCRPVVAQARNPIVPSIGTSTPRHDETAYSVALWKRRCTSPCTFSK